jgi:hypothetical protein
LTRRNAEASASASTYVGSVLEGSTGMFEEDQIAGIIVNDGADDEVAGVIINEVAGIIVNQADGERETA